MDFMEKIKSAWKTTVLYLRASKTLVYNFIIGVAGAIEAYSGFLRGLFHSDAGFGIFMVVIAAIGTLLRLITSRSVRDKVRELEREDA